MAPVRAAVPRYTTATQQLSVSFDMSSSMRDSRADGALRVNDVPSDHGGGRLDRGRIPPTMSGEDRRHGDPKRK
ncbi:unnamed protein product [Soboliphyme baturini]|uniref:Uncharacterized protein n=1 Tax=Soboliphyme baturini TaxID=241478 RepID=A0A183IRK8_9BILA|nr:unnamed protein product [Soboliphyme baturini]